MPLSLHPAAVTLVLKKLSLSGEKFICHFSTNTGSILSLLLRKEPDIYTSIIGAHYRQETEPDLGFFHVELQRLGVVNPVHRTTISLWNLRECSAIEIWAPRLFRS